MAGVPKALHVGEMVEQAARSAPLLVPALCVGTHLRSAPLLVPALCVGTPFSRRSAGDAPGPAVPKQSMVPTQSIGTRIR